MALSLQATGTPVATGPNTDPLICSPDFPGGYTITNDDTGYILVASKHDTSDTPTINAGWTLVDSNEGGGGVFGASGGPVRLTWFRRVLQSGDTAPTVSLAGATTGRVMEAVMVVYRSAGGTTISEVAAFGAQTVAATAWSAAMSTDPGIISGDELLLGYGVRDDGTAFTAMGVTATGATIGSATELAEDQTSSGHDQSMALGVASVTAGVASVAPTVTATIGATSETGNMSVLRLWEVAGSSPAPNIVVTITRPL